VAVYDDEKTNSGPLNPRTGDFDGKLRGPQEDMPQNPTTGGYTGGALRDLESKALSGDNPESPETRAERIGALKDAYDKVGKGFTNENDGSASKTDDNKPPDTLGRGFTGRGKARKTKARLAGLAKKKIAVVLATAGATGVLAIFGGFFGFINAFKLDFFLSNIEKNGFMRYQADLDRRSSKWMQAYLTLRMGEIEAPELRPQDRDNLIFRANRVDRNNPAMDWFRTLRTSSFEADLFESEGIKFTSVAQQLPDGSTRIRPGKITMPDREFTFELTDAEKRAVANGDVNGFNGRLQNFIDQEVFENDKQARKEIKRIVNSKLKPWQVIKKRHLRKDIQNMIGVRDWRFFETTRDRFTERRISVRNKFIVKALPESTKTGKFVQCMFGITSCKASSDVAHPENRSRTPSSDGQRQGETVETENENGERVRQNADDGRASGSIEGGLEDVINDDELGNQSLQRKFIAQIVNKFSNVVGLISILDSLSRIDKSMRDGSLSKMVVAARGAQTAAILTTLMIARDQMKEGELSADEVREFMGTTGNNLGRSEVWRVMQGGGNVDTVAAAAAENVGKNEYCSPEHQTSLVENEYHHMCDSQKVGGKNNAEKLESWWVNGPIGTIVGPVLSVYRNTVGGFFGKLFDIAGDLAAAILTPIIKPLLAASGLQDNLEDFAGWMLATVSSQLGAGPMIDTDTPSGVVGNLAGAGGAYLGESSARYQGAAATTAATRAQATKRTIAYMKELNESKSFSDRYLALDSPDSLAARQLYAASMNTTLSSPMTAMASIFNSIGKLPHVLTTTPASAQARDPYALAELAEVDTYDMPDDCIESSVINMTPQSATNADDVGLIPADELTWELLGNKEAFYDRLYRDNPNEDTALSVWNCGLIDTTIRGSLGARHGYTKDNAIASRPSSEESDTEDQSDGPTELASGESRELARQIVNSPKVTIASKYAGQIKGIADGSGSCHVNPTILQLIVTISKSHSIYISSLNRFCTSTLTASGTGSYHYREKGGHAVDIAGVDGQSSTGATQKDIQLLKKVLPLLPEGSGIGQSNCRATSGRVLQMPAGVSQFSDECNHIHIQVPVR